MIDKNALVRDLTDGFINYQYNLDNPRSFPSKQELIDTYQQDPYFRRKVDSMICGIMNILDKHL